MGDNGNKLAFSATKKSSINDENFNRRHEALAVASANIALTMLRRGKFLEHELGRALDHIRTSNQCLKEFISLLESADEDRRDRRGGAGSWLKIAEQVKSVAEWVDRCADDKDEHDDAEKEVTTEDKIEKETGGVSPAT
ncbi:hypothetical protein TSTA_028450 [Talaromyces stipitatus ATCC 10500]|uniref:Uncharacterized protein n=1 Tax=Talaromyces stipitatus (strain ATCC 10500 / CBS 375.48 / QM 6759 / NRRL 1006) TaxID=441959 RepID=B8M7K4_TALSN|nr:uncharacterized protein TSTA_028450 [Talaromyces stipitatus ATCC 10500]EED19557.1 hypothetical protein TSTA_028450 [Talaromyces stipitatus ATCC 10500]